jgi:sterol desaturase/sphingolipid hydroxylase (fatty acid hydroxylase superfamily)
VVWKNKWQLRRIQSVQRATSHHIRFDLFYSFVSFFIIAFTAGYITYLAVEGKTLMYFDVSKYGWGWIIVSFFIILFIDDMFFYWSHRAIHHHFSDRCTSLLL